MWALSVEILLNYYAHPNTRDDAGLLNRHPLPPASSPLCAVLRPLTCYLFSVVVWATFQLVWTVMLPNLPYFSAFIKEGSPYLILMVSLVADRSKVFVFTSAGTFLCVGVVVRSRRKWATVTQRCSKQMWAICSGETRCLWVSVGGLAHGSERHQHSSGM
jgi:hypothetical protein